MIKKASSTRNPALDILRCFALLCVVSAHFFKYSGYYNLIVTGARMYLLTLLRSASMVAVPLFLMLSGYLMANRRPERRYYRKLVKTLVVYALASACCYGYMVYADIDPTLSGSLPELLAKILNFTAAPYAWYMEMYIGLFLLIPYLNILYRSLETKKHKQGLILVLLVMTAIPRVTNIFTYSPSEGLFFSANPQTYQTLLPDWWLTLYPIVYYYLGCYLREYPVNWNRLSCGLWMAVSVLGVGCFNIVISRGTSFILGPWQDEGSVLNVIQTIPVFCFLAQAHYAKMPGAVKTLFAWLSDLCLAAYLVSWIFDDLFHKWLQQVQPVAAYKLEYFPFLVLAITFCSLALSAAVNLVYALLAKTAATLRPGKNT